MLHRRPPLARGGLFLLTTEQGALYEQYKYTNNIQKLYVVRIFYICAMEKKAKPPYQVRMSDELYATAMAKAKSLGLSFAAYVRYLISQDNNPK